MVDINTGVTPFKKMLFDEIRRYNTEIESLTDVEMNSLIFHVTDSLRLSLTGFIIVKKHFTAYSFEMPVTIRAKHQMALSKMEYPYAIRRKRLIVFSEIDAMVIKLHGGVEGFLETFSQID